jgi:hypothetical protein
MERGFHLPGARRGRVRAVAFGGTTLGVLDLSPAEMRALVAELRARPPCSDLTTRAAAIGRAASCFLDEEDPFRRRALAALPVLTGFSTPMIEAALPRVFLPLADADALAGIAGSANACVALLGIVAAGNVPGVALAKAALALAAGASCVVKSASGEPLLAALFAEALANVDPSLASKFAVSWWEGGSNLCEAEFLRGIDSLVAYGSDDAIESLATRGPERFVGHRHKLSIALVRLDAAEDLAEIAAAAAVDVAFYDQLGCLSPQSIFTVAGTRDRRRDFVEKLSRELAEVERRWPPGLLPEGQALAIRRLRDEYEWRGIRGEAVSVLAGGDVESWTIIDDPAPRFQPSPLHRTIFVRHLDSLAALRSALGAWLPRTESAGMAPWADAEARRVLSALGIPRLAPLGAMQSPDLAWQQGGWEPMAGIRAENPA